MKRPLPTVKLREDQFNKFLGALWLMQVNLPSPTVRKALMRCYESDFGLVDVKFSVQFVRRKKR